MRTSAMQKPSRNSSISSRKKDNNPEEIKIQYKYYLEEIPYNKITLPTKLPLYSSSELPIIEYDAIAMNINYLKKTKQQSSLESIKRAINQVITSQDYQSKKQLIKMLHKYDLIFKKVHYSLVQSIVFISKLAIYDYKQIVKNSQAHLGFVLVGKAKIHNPDYHCFIERGDTINEHLLNGKKSFKFQITTIQQLCILWLPFYHYQVLKQQSYKSGMKQQINMLDALIRLSFIRKKIK